jgi:hypothetical protein
MVGVFLLLAIKVPIYGQLYDGHSSKWTTRQLPQPLFQHLKIHRLGDELRGPVFIRTASPLINAVSRHHHDRQFWPASLDLTQQRQTVHTRHVDVGQNDDQLGIDAIVEFR